MEAKLFLIENYNYFTLLWRKMNPLNEDNKIKDETNIKSAKTNSEMSMIKLRTINLRKNIVKSQILNSL